MVFREPFLLTLRATPLLSFTGVVMVDKRAPSAAIEFMLRERLPHPSSETDSIRDWVLFHSKISLEWGSSVESALIGGYRAERVAYAFLSGFRSALQSLIPSLKKDKFVAFCVSEEGGNHPRAINTRLTEPPKADNGSGLWTLSGEKSFITGAAEADVILVAASIGRDPSGRNQVRMISIDKNAPGVLIKPMPPLPFIPEIQHASVQLDKVAVSENQFLPGDGYDGYIKPFRILEDLHVAAALLGYLFKIAKQYQWPREIQEQLIILMTMVGDLVGSDIFSSVVHIKFGGFDSLMKELLLKTDSLWKEIPESIQTAWRRDLQVMKVAEKARQHRLTKAWKDLVNN